MNPILLGEGSPSVAGMQANLIDDWLHDYIDYAQDLSNGLGSLLEY